MAGVENELDYREIRYRLQNHPSFRLLRKEKAALMLAFFVEAFKRGHRSDLPRGTLVSELNSFREFVALTEGEAADGRSAVSYLDEWADEGFLRKYYRTGTDEPSYDLTPESEKVVEWLRDLSERRFVGTQSRLLQVFGLMKDIAYGAVFDADERMAELERKKAEIEAEIERVRSGQSGPMEPTAVRERYYQLEDTARRLLADFRQIERNFRELDRDARARVIAADKGRGRVLKDIFEFRDAILSGDQGRSFQAFWAFVMSSDKKREFAALAERVLKVPEVAELPKSVDMEAFDRLLVAAGARVQGIAHLLNEDLRSFLDEKSRQEGRLVVRTAEEIKKLALDLRDKPPQDRDFLSFEDDPDIDLVMERPLFRPEATARIAERPEAAGSSSADAEVLFDYDEIDRTAIAARLREVLARRDQVSLVELLADRPIREGMAELLGYLSTSAEDFSFFTDESERDTVRADNLRRNRSCRVEFPRTVYIKEFKG